jgi:hypothetical protein
VALGLIAELERMFELVWDFGIIWPPFILKLRVPVNAVVSMAMIVVGAIVLPVFRILEPCQFHESPGLVLFEGPAVVFLPGKLAAHAGVVPALVAVDRRYGFASRVATDGDSESTGYSAKIPFLLVRLGLTIEDLRELCDVYVLKGLFQMIPVCEQRRANNVFPCDVVGGWTSAINIKVMEAGRTFYLRLIVMESIILPRLIKGE